MLAGLSEDATNVIKLFIDNFDGQRGTATIKQRLAATGDPDAWLVNWRAEDWVWGEQESHYTDGI